MKDKNKPKKIRIPLPKQRCQAFRDQTKYNRKRDKKGSQELPFDFYRKKWLTFGLIFIY